METIERYSVDELASLEKLASNFVQRSPSAECKWLYRNKSEEYFENIKSANKGWMNTKMKDKGGDKRSPINNCVKGLFFSASVEAGYTDARPREKSAFGRSRISIKISELAKDTNLYFADFYCMGNRQYSQGYHHYVIIVMCKSDSITDRFCDKFLLPLNWNSNRFLYKTNSTYRVTSKEDLLVEVFYTENINIVRLLSDNKAEMTHDIETFGQGHSTKGGKPKNANCAICNIHVYSNRYDHSARAQDNDVENLRQEYWNAVPNRNKANYSNSLRRNDGTMSRGNMHNIGSRSSATNHSTLNVNNTPAWKPTVVFRESTPSYHTDLPPSRPDYYLPDKSTNIRESNEWSCTIL